MAGHIPDNPYRLRAPGCADVADKLDAAIDKLRKWGLPGLDDGPLPTASSYLRGVTARGSYELDRLRDTAAALMLASDFIQIAYALSDARNGAIARELVKSIRGTLLQQDDDRALDFRSQFLFGSVLLKAGAEPRLVTSPNNPVPDYLCKVAGGEVTVETKRVGKETTALANLDKAVGQIASLGHPGMVVLDMSGLYEPYEFSTDVMDDLSGFRQRVVASFKARIAPYQQHILGRKETGDMTEEYRHLMGVICFARLCFWDAGDLASPGVHVPLLNGMLMTRETHGWALLPQVFMLQQKIKAVLAALYRDGLAIQPNDPSDAISTYSAAPAPYRRSRRSRRPPPPAAR
jgi:hypothetical protein